MDWKFLCCMLRDSGHTTLADQFERELRVRDELLATARWHIRDELQAAGYPDAEEEWGPEYENGNTLCEQIRLVLEGE